MAVKVPPTRPDEVRVSRLTRLADLHDAWVAANADAAGFHPGEHPKNRSDYNVHHVDLDGSPAALDEFATSAIKLFAGKPVAAARDDRTARQQAAWESAVAALLAAWPGLSKPLVDAITSAVSATDVAGLAALTAPQPLVDELAAAIDQAMADVARGAVTDTVADARTHGVTIDPPTPDGDRIAAVATVTASLIAAGYVAGAVRKALQVGPGGADAVRASLADAGATTSRTVGAHLGAAMSAAQNGGRRAVYEAHPPVALVASEHLDQNACAACREVDGTRYRSLAEALADYPGNGGFRACAGGLRCRGHVVAVWS